MIYYLVYLVVYLLFDGIHYIKVLSRSQCEDFGVFDISAMDENKLFKDARQKYRF